MPNDRPNAMFPNRPDHEDFRLLSSVIRVADAYMEELKDLPAVMLDVIDMKSMEYVTEQRVMMTAAKVGQRLDVMQKIFAQASWMDAFYMGYRFAQAKQAQAETSS